MITVMDTEPVKRKRGRPPGIPNPGTGRPKVLQDQVALLIRIERADHEALRAKADATGVTVTEICREAIKRAAR